MAGGAVADNLGCCGGRSSSLRSLVDTVETEAKDRDEEQLESSSNSSSSSSTSSASALGEGGGGDPLRIFPLFGGSGDSSAEASPGVPPGSSGAGSVRNRSPVAASFRTVEVSGGRLAG